jgi:hypothetical protein
MYVLALHWAALYVYGGRMKNAFTAMKSNQENTDESFNLPRANKIR